MSVKAWQEKVMIPTYGVGVPDKNPMFLEKRVYQGSSGVVYPHPVIDKVDDLKHDREWNAIFLENEYLKVMILPELGGRIQMAYDKTNDYHFIYHNEVIKPALVGLTGPWISGGIEFNWPQHHRPSTFDPLDFSMTEQEDGSRTVWVNEYEIMFRTKCALGFTMFPDRAYIKLEAKLYNRTLFPQSFLWWANPAVAVDEQYQSIFPPDVHAVYDHGRRDVSDFPIATGTYYKVDYSPGTDISVYTNIPVPTSYMAVQSKYDFVGGYHHGKRAGVMHVADHHISPGKKQWTWGCGDFGKAWDRQLTDDNGPYFEIMCGVFTDNQPDFSWIMPNEYRAFNQYFMPYKNIGRVMNASTDAMVNLDFPHGQVTLGVYVTSSIKVTVVLSRQGEVFFSESIDLSPRKTFSKEFDIDGACDPSDWQIDVLDQAGRKLVSYKPEKPSPAEIPEPAKPIRHPSSYSSNEDLFLAGLHLEQYRHATYNARDYYLEALRRDPADMRCNQAIGLMHMRTGQFQEALPFLKKSVGKLMTHNPNPYDGEPLYNLGLTLKMLGRTQDAEDMLFKSAWNASMQDNAFLQLAMIRYAQSDFAQSLELVERSLLKNLNSLKARHLKACILRRLGRYADGVGWCIKSVALDGFDFGSRYELCRMYRLCGDPAMSEQESLILERLMRKNPDTHVEISLDYLHMGDPAEAFVFLSALDEMDRSAIVFYHLGFFLHRLHEKEAAMKCFMQAFECSADRVFPNRFEDIWALEVAMTYNPKDHKALFHMGNYAYSRKQFDRAIECWELSVQCDDGLPTVHRNLGIAYFNKRKDKALALRHYEKALLLDATDARVLYELDQLHKRLLWTPSQRLAFLLQYEGLISSRDDLYIEYIMLLSLTGEWERARQLLLERNFHPWEGGEGRVSGQYVLIQVELAKSAIQDGRCEEALSLLERSRTYPDGLGEGKLHGAQENDIDYWTGCAYALMGDRKSALSYWEKASLGADEPSAALFYNDPKPDRILYQGLSSWKLGRKDVASRKFLKLIAYAQSHMGDDVKIDFFAVSLPDLMIFDDDLNLRNFIHCSYLEGLGLLGSGDAEGAIAKMDAVLSMDPSHAGAYVHRNMILQHILSHMQQM